MAYKIKYIGRHPIHAKGMDGKEVTLYRDTVMKVSELPEDMTYIQVLAKPAGPQGVEKPKKGRPKRVKNNDG